MALSPSGNPLICCYAEVSRQSRTITGLISESVALLSVARAFDELLSACQSCVLPPLKDSGWPTQQARDYLAPWRSLQSSAHVKTVLFPHGWDWCAGWHTKGEWRRPPPSFPPMGSNDMVISASDPREAVICCMCFFPLYRSRARSVANSKFSLCLCSTLVGRSMLPPSPGRLWFSPATPSPFPSAERRSTLIPYFDSFLLGRSTTQARPRASMLYIHWHNFLSCKKAKNRHKNTSLHNTSLYTIVPTPSPHILDPLNGRLFSLGSSSHPLPKLYPGS